MSSESNNVLTIDLLATFQYYWTPLDMMWVELKLVDGMNQRTTSSFPNSSSNQRRCGSVELVEVSKKAGQKEEVNRLL